jgi:hypothetical protein
MFQLTLSQNKPPSIVNRKLQFWSSDFHISPIADFKYLLAILRPWDTVKDESLSGHCHLMNTCASRLEILTRENGLSLSPCPNQLKRNFWNRYQNHSLMNSIDVFLCHHAFGLCEAFMVFDRPMILVASTRYEIGRLSSEHWMRLNDNLRAIASKPWNTIAANNHYDREYITHFTGLKNVELIPNYCGYTNASYSPSNLNVLIGPSRLSLGGERVLNSFLSFLQNCQDCNTRYTFAKLRDKYPIFTYSDIVKHPAILILPYQVSVMSFLEYYRMNIPILAPSQKLLTKWHLKFNIMNELSWNCVYGKCQDSSSIPAHNDSHHPFDPNNITSPESMAYWIKFADFYQYPFIIYFDSWNDIIEKLNFHDLHNVSSLMKAFNVKDEELIGKKWNTVISKVTSFNLHKVHETKKNHFVPWNQKMIELYSDVSYQIVEEC